MAILNVAKKKKILLNATGFLKLRSYILVLDQLDTPLARSKIVAILFFLSLSFLKIKTRIPIHKLIVLVELSFNTV